MRGEYVGAALLSAGLGTWGALTELELAALLDSQVQWAGYGELMTDHPALGRTVGPVVEFATGLSPSGQIKASDILINTALTVVPLGRLAPIMKTGGTTAVTVGPDVLVLVDDVVVAQIKGGASRVVGALDGSVDDAGRVVVSHSAAPLAPAAAVDTSIQKSVAEIPRAETLQPLAPLKKAASGAVIQQVHLRQLPSQAQDVIALIQVGGPFKYERDGLIFANNEKRLPAQRYGYYQEYTVETPGVRDRGERRIVSGDKGAELYYTDDHYETFVEVILRDG